MNDPELIEGLSRWYKGSIVTINALRPNTHIDDEEIPALLHKQKDSIFITINYDDFWRKVETHQRYCVICFKLTQQGVLEISDLLRELLQLEEFKTKRKRRGLVISVRDGRVSYYD